MVIIEKNFPRGGVGNLKKANEVNPKEETIFGTLQKKTKRPVRDKSTNLEEDVQNKYEQSSSEVISYETIQDGMVIMGIVSSVDHLDLTVSLPGRISARVSALEISDSYCKATTKFIQNSDNSKDYKPLIELFNIGQLIYGRIEEIKQTEKGTKQINMTLKPSEVNKDLLHTNIKKGFLFSGAIEEIQEHGCIIESGIRGLRCFLPTDKTNETEYAIGELIFLKVDSVKHDKSATTAICKKMKEGQFTLKSVTDPNLDYIFPSTIVKFKISNILKDGLQGTILNESVTAFVNEHYLNDSLTLPEDFEINTIHKARILYIMPITKIAYLTLNIRAPDPDKIVSNNKLSIQYKRGDLIENARVHHLGTGGIILVLDNHFKGIISYKSVKGPFKGNYDHDELVKKYTKKSSHIVRVLGFDIMESIYFCTDEPTIVNEKFFVFDDIKPGDFVNGTIQSFEKSTQSYIIKIGKLKGLLEKMYMSSNVKIQDHAKIRVRVLSINEERKILYLTNRQEYMQKDVKILTNLSEAKPNRVFMGTIVKIGSTFLLVKFFNGIQGFLYVKGLPANISTGENGFYEGQTMYFRISEANNNKLTLTLPDQNFKLGEICPVMVKHKLDTGVEIEINLKSDSDEDGCNDENNAQIYSGFIPISYFSDHEDIQMAEFQMAKEGTTFSAASLGKNIFSVRDLNYFQKSTTNDWSNVKPGDILKGYIKNVDKDIIELMLLLNNFEKIIKVHWKMLIQKAFLNSNIAFSIDQVIYAKVLSKEVPTKSLAISAKLMDVWNGELSFTSEYIANYLKEMSNIKNNFQKENQLIAKYEVGDKVTAQFREVDEQTNDWIFSLENNVTGIIRESFVRKTAVPKKGKEQECIVLWINYSKRIVYLSNKDNDLAHIKKGINIPSNLIGKSGMTAKILLKMENLLICSLKKGLNPIVYCPMRLHYNDFENSIGINLKEGEFHKMAFIHDSLPIAVPEITWKLWKHKNLKRQVSTIEEIPSKKARPSPQVEKEHQEISNESGEKLFIKSKKDKVKLVNNQTRKQLKTIKSKEENCTPAIEKITSKEASLLPQLKREHEEISNVVVQKLAKTSSQERVKNIKNKDEIALAETKSQNTNEQSSMLLPFFEDKQPNHEISTNHDKTRKNRNQLLGVQDFWESSINSKEMETYASSSEDDEALSNTTTQKRKKLTTTEKFQQSKKEELRLREIEEKFADSKHLPETVEQFEKLVISDPNNSKNWINFMVHHLQSAELDKARAVARRALKTISFKSSDDLLNMWSALLNLELRYGSKDNFDETLKEALTCNDPLKIYLRVIDIMTSCKKMQELVDLLNIFVKKFKGEPDAWKAAASAYFEINMPDKAQHMLHRALACLPEREHVNTIVAFANINYKFNNKEIAQTLFDQIVTSYPKRVDVWSQYTDMLVKDNLIDQARAVLERATLQKIPIKKMRTLFKKFLDIEQRFGTSADVERVKNMAVEYVKNSSII